MDLKSDMLHASTASFIVLLIAASDFYVNIPTKSMNFYATSFYLFGEKSMQNLHDLYGEFNK